MTELEATRMKLKCLEMVEGTGLRWYEVIKLRGKVVTNPLDFTSDSLHYKPALGLVECKPVWEGDYIYHNSGHKFRLATGDVVNLSQCSWNPPKPKTVMVELSVEDARIMTQWGGLRWYDNLADACRKALEGL